MIHQDNTSGTKCYPVKESKWSLFLENVVVKYISITELWVDMETITIPKEEYKMLKHKAEVDEDLLVSLVRGLEDIKAGRIKPWKRFTN